MFSLVQGYTKCFAMFVHNVCQVKRLFSYGCPHNCSLPILCISTIKVVFPITNSKLLVERSVISTYIRYPSTILITHVKDLAVVFSVSIESHRSVATVESECQVRKIFPSLCLYNKYHYKS